MCVRLASLYPTNPPYYSFYIIKHPFFLFGIVRFVCIKLIHFIRISYYQILDRKQSIHLLNKITTVSTNSYANDSLMYDGRESLAVSPFLID